MSHRFLLDTNILSELTLQPQGRVADHITKEGEETVCTSIVVASELRFGAAKRGSSRLTAQLEEILSVIDILPLEPPVDRHYAALRVHLERAGTPIGPNDLWIAAQGLSLNLIVVTANIKEFTRVLRLVVENWAE